jgi:GNAT superfamily N-acetyltransferase
MTKLQDTKPQAAKLQTTKLQTIVTHLAMEPPFRVPAPPPNWPDGVDFIRVSNMALADYRDIYDRVGRKWHWVNRRHLDDRQLAALIHNPATEIYLLRRNANAIGFVELNFRLAPQVEIVFVGMVEDEIGQGLGRKMVDAALNIIKARAPRRIIIQTCTLDHPSALRLYQTVGFTAYNRKQVEIIDK